MKKPKTYIRFGYPPKDSRSVVAYRNYRLGHMKGVSVYEYKDGIIMIPFSATAIGTLFGVSERPAFIVTGKEVGRGTDGEILLTDIKIIEKIKSDDVKEMKMRKIVKLLSEIGVEPTY